MIHFTAQNLSRRLVAVICLALGVFAARYFDDKQTSTPTAIPVRLLPNPALGGGGSGGKVLPSAFEDRDFTEYVFGEETEECSWQTGSELRTCVANRAAAREFVFRHWKAKEKAYIAIHFPCADCDPVDHIFVEPDGSGEWRIVITPEDARFGLFDREIAFDLRYRRATADERERDPSKRRLSFVDMFGREIDSF